MDNWDFTTMAFTAGLLIALICSYMGLFIVLRKISFVGIALAQLAAAGIALAELTGLSHAAGAAMAMLAGTGILARDPSKTRLPSEALVGSVYAMGGAGAIMLTAFNPMGDTDAQTLLYGNILGVTPAEIKIMLIAFGAVALFMIIFSKEMMLISFDAPLGLTLGYKVKLWNLLFFLALGLTIAVSIHSAGILFCFSMLILPALTGLALSRRWNLTAIISAASATLAVTSGIWASLHWDLPTGPAIVTAACIIFAIAWPAGRIFTK